MAGNNGGPWGGGGNDGGDDDDDRYRPNGGRDDDRSGGRRPSNEPQIPEFDEIINKTKDQLRVLMGGGNGRARNGGGGGGGSEGPQITRGMVGIAALVAVGVWAMSSFYTVRPEQRSVELFLGKFSSVGEPGLNFAPWPLVTYEVVNVSQERVIEIGEEATPLRLDNDRVVANQLDGDIGLMLTGDENIIDIDFQVAWNITQPDMFLFNLADPEETIAAVAESVMREIIAQSEAANVNRERNSIAQRWLQETQDTLDSYDSGVNIVRITLGAADPPATQVTTLDFNGDEKVTSPSAAFRDVQDAEQERIQLQNNADAYANSVTADARGNAAQILADAEGYRARVVNEASGEAARFLSVLTEFQKAPEVTRERLYLEMMEDVFSSANIILLDDAEGGTGAVPYLPLEQLRTPSTGGSN